MDVDVVILEATSVSLGLAAALQERCRVLLINRTALVAPEFINSFKPEGNIPDFVESPPGIEILSDLKQEGLVENGQCRLYSTGPHFYRAFSRLTIDQWFETDLIEMTRKDRGYSLKVMNQSGICSVNARVVIDTRNAKLEKKSKTLNALLVSRDPHARIPENTRTVSFIRERDSKPSTVLMRITCTDHESLFTARHRLIESWQDIAETYPQWKIAAIALVFDITPLTALDEIVRDKTKCFWERSEEPGLIYLPGSGFSHPLTAIDAGYRLGKALIL
jgi:hypothetical protein